MGPIQKGCGGSGCGTVFELTPEGVLTTLYSFCLPTSCNTGSNLEAGLILATDGNFYGTAANGGGHNHGVVFRITPTGSLIELPFIGQSGFAPSAPVVQGIDGSLYGTTQRGGPNLRGNVFKVSPGGILTDLYNFCSQPGCVDGAEPVGGLVQASDGNFYGTTNQGGTGTGGICIGNGCGIVFRITPQGTLTRLYSFCSQTGCPDGAYPNDPLVEGADGYFYGTAQFGGAQGDGTVFRIDSKGVLTTVYSFCSVLSCVDGMTPSSGLVQATDGNFYGITGGGGANNSCTFECGTIYEITPTGTLTTLHSFDGSDGETPVAGLLQATNGMFYGTTHYCQGNCDGTVFSLSTGLAPFVAFVQKAAKVRRTAEILGQGFTGTTSVSFNGTSASFTIQSDTYLTATVPAGATTGYVTVTTPGGTLSSKVPFHVIP